MHPLIKLHIYGKYYFETLLTDFLEVEKHEATFTDTNLMGLDEQNYFYLKYDDLHQCAVELMQSLHKYNADISRVCKAFLKNLKKSCAAYILMTEARKAIYFKLFKQTTGELVYPFAEFMQDGKATVKLRIQISKKLPRLNKQYQKVTNLILNYAPKD